MHSKLGKVRLVFSDVDGVLTDGGLYYGAAGEMLKKFNVKDGFAAGMLLERGFRLGVLTGRRSPFVEARFTELCYEFIIQGASRKLVEVERVLQQTGLRMENVAYMGDELNDAELMRQVGFSACPADAVDEIKAIADWVCTKKGGEGAFREFADVLLEQGR